MLWFQSSEDFPKNQLYLQLTTMAEAKNSTSISTNSIPNQGRIKKEGAMVPGLPTNISNSLCAQLSCKQPPYELSPFEQKSGNPVDYSQMKYNSAFLKNT